MKQPRTLNGNEADMDEKHLRIYAGLMAKLAISEAQIKANPLPHLGRAAERIVVLEKAIGTALSMLNGADTFDVITEPDNITPIRPIKEEAYERNRKAYNRLNSVL